MADTREITVTINGETETREVETRLNLADFLRHELELTGTHVGCEHGACGACTVLLDGRPVYACMTLASTRKTSGSKRWRGWRRATNCTRYRTPLSGTTRFSAAFARPAF